MSEPIVAEQWLYDQIAALPAVLATNGVYAYVAEQGTAPPFVVFQQQAGRDLIAIGGARVWAELDYLVRVIGEGSSFTPLEPVVDAIDAALHDHFGSAAGGEVLHCVRDRPWSQSYIEAGVQFRELGGVYRLRVQ